MAMVPDIRIEIGHDKTGQFAVARAGIQRGPHQQTEVRIACVD